LLIDGQIVNDPRTGAANGSARMLTVAQIYRVEVIRGPGSALYGSGAYGGVINVVTRKDVNEWTLHAGHLNSLALTGLSNFSESEVTFNSYVHVSQDDGSTYNLDDTFSDISSDRIDTRDPRDLVEIRADVNFGSTRASLLFSDVEGEDFYSLENIANGVNFNRYTHRSVQLEHEFRFMRDLNSKLSVQYASIEQHLDSQITAEGTLDDPTLSNPQSSDPVIIKALVRADGYRFNWHNDWEFKENLSFQLGINWQRANTLTSKADNNFNSSQLSLAQFPVEYYGDFTQASYSETLPEQDIIGVYSQSIYGVGDHQLNLGLRYDSNDTVADHWSPRLGWVYSLTDNSTIKLLYGQAFRAASLSEQSNPNSPILRGDPELKHELIESVDAVYLYQESTFNLQAGIFYNHYRDPIIITLENDNVRQYINGDSSESVGLELESNLNLHDDVWFRFSFSEFVETPQSFFREATRSGSLMLNGFFHSFKWNIAAVYQGARETEVTAGNFETLPGQWLAGSKVSYQWNEQAHWALQVKNLFDEVHRSSPQGEELPEGVPSRGREITISIAYKW